MFPARLPGIPVPPLRVALLTSSSTEEDAEPEEVRTQQNNQNLSPHRSFFLLRYFRLLRVTLPPQVPLTPRTVLAMAVVKQMRCTPRSYNDEMNTIFTLHTDPRISEIYLTQALNTIPLSTLTNSEFFCGHDNFSHVCERLVKQPSQ
ncbi:MAG TPA: hypothetical protein VMR37_04130, partial [Rhabdochlamydiaceae bacterium]|nr:hypothetical protein [Rhabdochlamydiaceae bacterium]